MLVLNEKEMCTGCAACTSICPKNAISMLPDNEGFLYPNIDETACIHCDLCHKICPQTQDKYLNNGPIELVAGVVNENELLLSSSSGGAFSAICRAFDSEAIVCGVAFKDLKASHKAVKNGEDTSLFRKSKYLQSDTGDIYLQVKKYLGEGKQVIFSGTSCQVAGLYSFLGGKPEKLYTIDLICHGVPSQRVFDSYIASLSKKTNTAIKDFSFRDKKYLWGDWEIGTAYFNGKKWKHLAWGQDSYMTGFLRGLYYRPVCYSCKYANEEIRRPADITLGDFWGSKRYGEEFDDKRGCSLIIANSEKGTLLIKQLNQYMKLFSVQRAEAISENHNLIEPTRMNTYRNGFFERLEQGEDFVAIIKSYYKRKSHSQAVRVIATRLFPWMVEKKRKIVRNERQQVSEK